jgi:flavin reductase (DIM6/NTAB) family NADH-FMN oxidoreductase RutF
MTWRNERLLPEPATLRRTFAGFPSGVAAISAHVDGINEVIVASSFTVGVSLDPPLVLFAVQNSSRSWPRLKAAPMLGVSVLASDQDEACRQLASGPPEERFRGLEFHHASTGAVFLRYAPVWLECTVWQEVLAGDHTLVILEIHGLFRDETVEPLVFHGSTFRRLEPLTP